MIEPGTLIVGVSEKGILHQLQLCKDQEGKGLVGMLVGSWPPQQFLLSLEYLEPSV